MLEKNKNASNIFYNYNIFMFAHTVCTNTYFYLVLERELKVRIIFY